MIFVTASGSTYEVDKDNKRVRRLNGKKDPTPRQGKDGEWRTYLDITEVQVGASVIIFWDPKTTPKLEETIALERELGHEVAAAPSTFTSPVQSIVS